jgi:hypothetical protein
MDPTLLANLPNYAPGTTPVNVHPLWSDEGLVNSIWNAILTHTFPTTLVINTYVVAPELQKGTSSESYYADLAVMQVANTTPLPTYNTALLCFEGKGGSNNETLNDAAAQVAKWASKLRLGSYGKLWGIAAKANTFIVMALDKARSDSWYWVILPTATSPQPTYCSGPIFAFDVTDANTLAGLQLFLQYIQVGVLPKVPPTVPRCPGVEVEDPVLEHSEEDVFVDTSVEDAIEDV